MRASGSQLPIDFFFPQPTADAVSPMRFARPMKSAGSPIGWDNLSRSLSQSMAPVSILIFLDQFKDSRSIEATPAPRSYLLPGSPDLTVSERRALPVLCRTSPATARVVGEAWLLISS